MKKLLILLAFLPLFLKGQDSSSVVYFDNTNYLTVNDHDSLTFANSGVDEAFSISADIYMVDATEFRFIAKSQTLNIEYIFFVNSSDKVAVLLYSGGGLTTYIGRLQTANVTAYQNQWINLAFSYDGSESGNGITIYLNGSVLASSAISSGSYTGMANTTAPLTIGTDRTTTAFGRMSNIRLMRGTLSAQDLTQIQTTNKTSDEVAWYPCTDGYSTIVHNVTNRNMFAVSTADNNNHLWLYKRVNFDYNHIYGYTQVISEIDTFILPYLFDSTRYFKNYDYVVIAGQSNARGRGLLTDLSAPDQALYWKVYNNSFIYDTATFNYNKLNPPTNNYNNATNGFGCELSLSYNYQLAGDSLLIFKYGFPETPLYDTPSYRDWYPTTGEIFTRLVYNMKLSIKNSFKYGYNPQLKSFVWMQGETDALSEPESNNYQTHLDYFFDSLTQSFSSVQFYKTIGRISNSSVLTYRSAVRTAQSTYSGIGGNLATLVNTDTYGLAVDNVHYNASGQISFGNDVYIDVSSNQSVSAGSMLGTFIVYDYPEPVLSPNHSRRVTTTLHRYIINEN